MLNTRFVSSFVPDKFVSGKPTPIFNAAAVGNTCLGKEFETCFGVDVFNGGRMILSMELSDFAGHKVCIVLCKCSIRSISSALCVIRWARCVIICDKKAIFFKFRPYPYIRVINMQCEGYWTSSYFARIDRCSLTKAILASSWSCKLALPSLSRDIRSK